MEPSFNLLEQSFIPVEGAHGRVECSLRETLLRAPALQELRAASPLVTIALHRLLLAILHRNFGPTSTKAWQKLREGGRFPEAPLEAYFDRWRSRFDLFDPKRPFFQDPAFRAKAPSGINQLVRELSRGNNATLFDHTSESPPPLVSPAETARALIAEQAFAVGGGKSELGYTTSAPLIGGVAVLVRGENLFETLLLNLLRYDEGHPLPSDGDDAPAWEQEGRPTNGPPAPAGYVDYLTWQSRSIHLHPEPDGRVRWMSFAQGRKLNPAQVLYDPMMAYQRDEENGDRPIRLSEAKALWRDSAALFQFAETDTFRGPANLRWLRDLRAANALPRDRVFTLSALGLCTDKAKVNFWRHETLPLPLDYVTDSTLVAALKSALDLAKEVGDAVRGATATLVSKLLAPGDRTPDKNRLWAVVDSLAADKLYWSRLEGPFREFVVGLPGTAEHQKGEIDAWFRKQLKPTALAAFAQTGGQLDHSGRALRARVVGEQQLGWSLGKIAKQNRIELPLPKGASA